MNYQEKLDAAVAILRERNEAIGSGNPGHVDTDKFVTSLKAYDALTNDDLIKLSWEHILDILDTAYSVKPPIRPRLLAEKIADIFREKKVATPAEEDKKRPASTKKAERMTIRELVECMDPEEWSNPVALRLRTISRGEPFIVFSTGRMVDVDTSARLLNEIKQGWEGRKTIEVNGNIRQVYRLGELPDNYAEENPIYEGRPLRPDGTCDQTNRSWAGVDLKLRQFVRLAIQMKVLLVANIDAAHYILDLAMQPDALPNLRKRYQQVAVAFDELEKTGNLPRLQIAIKTQKDLQKAQGGQNRPFDHGKKVEWVVPEKTIANYWGYRQ